MPIGPIFNRELYYWANCGDEGERDFEQETVEFLLERGWCSGEKWSHPKRVGEFTVFEAYDLETGRS